MSNWDTKSATDILNDINLLMSEVHEVVPQTIYIPYGAWYLMKRLWVINTLKTRKRNKRRPAFATAWRKA